ncbi:MAG: aldehyde dehydrogenase family protein [Thaumarchaeota archaeon]|jgi:1-pyrroline-5-carboxylate dehydrogenase|nr:aldehyde dehydrogenase family protein [Candidatus Terraquivivens yellowstonensis]MCL7392183.1 aldehyde dehydrogenase family protein [Candidatus Terraquivivens yellowstonensis]
MQKAFVNEMTWLRMSQSGLAEDFHRKYEKALEEVSSQLGKHHPLYIGGEPVYSNAGEFVDRSPIDTRIIIGYFQKAQREHVRKAIESAKEGFEYWGYLDWRKRVEIVRRAADIMSDEKFILAATITLENGKNRFEAMADVDEAIDYLRYYAYLVESNDGFVKKMGSVYPGERAISVMKPYGVWAIISPFNFPLAILVGMSSGALVTGNTLVLKPASDTPYIALKYYEILIRAGVPKNVVNYITGSGRDVQDEFLENENLMGIAFTGSWEVGSMLYARFSSKAPRPFIAEMGGKNATIVTESANIEKAVEGVIRGAFGYGGQKCSATSRLLVHRNIKDRFLKRLLERLPEFKVGDPRRRDVFMGPLINERALNSYVEYVELAKKDGKVLYGGRVLKEGELANGFYVEPTVVEGLPREHRLWREELFVPILLVKEFNTLEEAIEMANDSDYGLTAGIFSENKEEIEMFFNKIQAGVVYANRTVGSTTGAVVGVQAFGGWKRSGSTGKGAGGVYYLYQFMREQSQSTYE